MIDVVFDYMLAPLSFQAKQHLQGADASKYVAGLWQPGWIWQQKSPKGYPWDGNAYDEQYVYQIFTEGPQGWTDPTSYKQFVSKSWPNGHGGIAWCPRYFNPPLTGSLVTVDTSYNTYQGGKQVGVTQNLGGPAVTQLYGPVTQDVGALKQADTIIQSYQWGTNLANMEVNTYARGYGWVMWQLWQLQGGVYKLTSSISLYDQVASGGTPALVFPGTLP